MTIPALAKILIVFVAVILGTRMRVTLGVALLGGGIALDLWAGNSLYAVGQHLVHACLLPELWLLVVVTALILELGRYVTEARNAGALIARIKRWSGRHGKAVSLMALPSIIGLIPMPGGALVSAPFVEKTLAGDDMSPEWKVAVNYWFRHTWEFWFPLFPVVIVTLSIFEIAAWKFFLVQGLFTPIALFVGYAFLVRPHREVLAAGAMGPEEDTAPLWLVVFPLVIVVLTTIFMPPAITVIIPGVNGKVAKLSAMLAGLGIAMWLIHGRKQALEGSLWSTIKQRKNVNVLITLAGVMMFQSMLESSGMLPRAGHDLVQSGIPIISVVMILPFIAGLVTGIAIGFAGTAFPLIAGLLQTDVIGSSTLATLVLAFGFGYAGMMLSPIHLCFALTREYFSASFRKVYPLLLPGVAVMLLITAVMHWAIIRAAW